MSKMRRAVQAWFESEEPGPPAEEDYSDARIKHLEFIQAAILRMASNSFLFKGWAISLASGLAALAAVESRHAVLFVAVVSTLLFWAMDAYYLWLERGFVGLHVRVAQLPANHPVDYAMVVDKSHPFRRWLRTVVRWHLVLLYGTIVMVNIVGAIYLKEVKSG